ncbi:hypothetical protein RVIR1_06920 [Candidatus Rickettsiella viridis]|uniref:Uncharacterized protein n=1 Tax=Candidatus Rickettsiella viridis TaxID=676208 RepID=A0A2Z5UUG4_9COXI|nr:hypothetical protein [Candidatus Rickettsiella viridis]BBB15189.1 hypothetical protein RVIR1_06920 [Candidatus Rickettsiella viridis]
MAVEKKSNESVLDILNLEYFKVVEKNETDREEELEKIRQALSDSEFSEDFTNKIFKLYAEKPKLAYAIKFVKKLKQGDQFSEDEILNIIPVFFTINLRNIKAFETWILSTEAKDKDKDKALFVVQQLIDKKLIEKVSFEQISSLMQKANYDVMIKAYLDFIQITVAYPKITSSSNRPNQANSRTITEKSNYETLKENSI